MLVNPDQKDLEVGDKFVQKDTIINAVFEITEKEVFLDGSIAVTSITVGDA